MSNHPISRRAFCRTLTALGVGALSGCASAVKKSRASSLYNRFFIMDTSFWENKLDAKSQVDILKKVGIPKSTDSLNQWDEFPQVLKTFDENHVAMKAVYVRLSIDDATVPPFIVPLIDRLKGRGTLLWLNVVSQKYKPSDPAGDSAAVPLIQQIADRAEQAGLSISLYHHRGDWMERVGDTYRLAFKANRDNVGCTFNLYHWMFNDGPDTLDVKARMVLPKLNCVTINGAMKNTAQIDVRQAILPLGEGDYDVEGFVRTFVKLGYKGPFAFQGYGIGGDIQTKLTETVQTWRAICENVQGA